MEQKRGEWGSNFGFLMAAVGSAVGLGNIWGFPYKMGMYGGFAFLLVYLLLVCVTGFSVMIGELALGRKYGHGAVGTYKLIAKKYTWVGYMGVASGFFILAFYSVLGGMVLKYMMGFLVEMFGGVGFRGMAGAEYFGTHVVDTGNMLLFYAVYMLINIVIVMGGVSGGIEKFSKIGMPALAVMLLIVIIRSVTLPGASVGLEFMFKPNFAVFTENGIMGFFDVLRMAAGQMFFSLSLGMGCMITYGSYLSKKENVESNAVIIPIADTSIAIMAGLAVLPAVGAFMSQGVPGIEFKSGPGLLFMVMHEVFQTGMGGFIGNLFGFLFYLLVLIAAITSSISLLEVCTAYIIDKRVDQSKDPERKKVTWIIGAIIFVVGLPVALDGLGGGGVVGTPAAMLGIQNPPMAFGSWLDFYDCLSEGIMMPLGAMIMSIIIGWIIGTKTVKGEVEETPGVKMKGFKFWEICFKFIVPIVMVVVLVSQLMDFFG